MKFSVVSAFFAVALAMPLEQQRLVGVNDMRLIETAPNVREFLTEEQMLDLKRQGINFMDVTEHQYEGHEDGVHSSMFSRNSTYPLEVQERELFGKLEPELSAAELKLKLTQFTSFFTRYARSQSGLDSSLWLYNKVRDLAGDRPDVSVKLFDHDWLQKSLIVSINGTKNSEKTVIVGAHQDSINLLLPSVLPSPGADDDGSGTVTTLEVLRVLLESGYKPKNTLEFHWYSAEELGLLGSQDVFAEYSKKGVDVRAMLQQDMTGYSAGSKDKNDGKDELGVITDFVDPALTKFIELVITEYCSIPYVETQCGYACSDHSSASKNGYQSAFVIESAFENSDHKIHTTEDKVEYLDFDHMLEHAKLTLGYAIELSSYEDL